MGKYKIEEGKYYRDDDYGDIFYIHRIIDREEENIEVTLVADPNGWWENNKMGIILNEKVLTFIHDIFEGHPDAISELPYYGTKLWKAMND